MLNGIGLAGGSLRVSLVVRNPNFYPLSTAGLDYRLLVRDSVTVAHGADSTHRRVPSHDSTVVDLPMEVTWRGLSVAGSDIVANGLVTYRFVGDILLDTPVGVHRVPLDQTGRFAPLR
jgi:LEA14-like dessication related protein